MEDFHCKKHIRFRSRVMVDSDESRNGKNYSGSILSFFTTTEDLGFDIHIDVTNLPNTTVSYAAN